MTKIQIPISLSGDIVCTCGSPNSAGIAEENPLNDRAFSMSKQFHVTERSDGSGQTVMDVAFLQDLLQETD